MTDSLKLQLVKLLTSGNLKPAAVPQQMVKPLSALRKRTLGTPKTATSVIVPPTGQEPLKSIPEPVAPSVPDSTPDLATREPMQLVPVIDREAIASAKRLRSVIRSIAKEDVDPDFGRDKLARAQRMARQVHTNLAAYIGKNRTEEARAALTASRWISNATTSVVEAMAMNSLERNELRTVRTESLNRLEIISAFLGNDEPQIVEATSLKDLPAHHFTRYNQLKSRLPSEMRMLKDKLKLKVLKLPVVVIFGREFPPITGAQLTDLGFDATSEGDYVVLQDQSIWAICVQSIIDSEVWDGDEEGYVNKMLTQHQKRNGGVKVEFAGPEKKLWVASSATKGIHYYWVMPSRELRALPSYVKDWGFPFS